MIFIDTYIYTIYQPVVQAQKALMRLRIRHRHAGGLFLRLSEF